MVGSYVDAAGANHGLWFDPATKTFLTVDDPNQSGTAGTILNGINDANSLDLTNGMTIEAWINPTNLTGFKTLISKENGTSNLAYALSANNGASNVNNQRPVGRIRIGTSLP